VTDQKNPPWTREQQIADLIGEFGGIPTAFEKEIAERHIRLAEARGRAEALAELRAGAEPVGHVAGHFSDGQPMARILGEKHLWMPINTPLYTHPPVAREAELEAALREAGEAFDRIGGAMAACKSRPRAGVCGQTVDAMIRASDFTIPGALVLELGEMAELIRAALAAAPETRG